MSDKRTKELAHYILEVLRKEGTLRSVGYSPMITIPHVHIETLEWQIAKAIKSFEKPKPKPQKIQINYGISVAQNVKKAYEQLQKKRHENEIR